MQWFLKMDKLAVPALDAVMSDMIRFVPPKFRNTYRHWMENIKDWCISRQLWWGHRIPAWYLPEGGYVVAETAEEALELARRKCGADLQLATCGRTTTCWIRGSVRGCGPSRSSTASWHPGNPEIRYYYPTNDLVTRPTSSSSGWRV